MQRRNYLETFALPVYHMPLYIIIKEWSRFNRLPITTRARAQTHISLNYLFPLTPVNKTRTLYCFKHLNAVNETFYHTLKTQDGGNSTATHVKTKETRAAEVPCTLHSCQLTNVGCTHTHTNTHTHTHTHQFF